LHKKYRGAERKINLELEGRGCDVMLKRNPEKGGETRSQKT